MLLVLILYILFASTFTLGKAALDFISPIFFIGIRMSLTGIAILGYLYFFRRQQWKFKVEDLSLFVRLALFHIFISFVLEFWALQYVTSFKTALIFNLSPFITALLSFWLFSERLRLKQWLGLLIGLIGAMPMLVTHVKIEDIVGHFGVFSFPELALLGAVLSASYGWLIVQQLVSKKKYSVFMVNGVAMFWGGLLALVLSFFSERLPFLYAPPHYQEFFLSQYISSPLLFAFIMAAFYMIALIIIANIICFNLYGALLKHYSATFLAFAGFTTPLFTAVFGWFFLGEMISWHFVVSVLAIFCGLYLFYQEELKAGNLK